MPLFGSNIYGAKKSKSAIAVALEQITGVSIAAASRGGIPKPSALAGYMKRDAAL